MSTVTNYVDISTKSLVIAGVVFIIVILLSKYILESYSDPEEKRSVYTTLFYSAIIGIIFAIMSLVLFKQFSKFGTGDIMTDPFPTRN